MLKIKTLKFLYLVHFYILKICNKNKISFFNASLFFILKIAAWYAKYEINTFYKIQTPTSIGITKNWLGLQQNKIINK